MDAELQQLRSVLLRGQKLSMQGPQDHKAPAAESLPDLLESRRNLLNYTKDHPEVPEAWDLLSVAQECLLDLENARRSLERSIDLAKGRDKKALKRLARLRENETAAWGLRLTQIQLDDLAKHLEAKLGKVDCKHRYDHTKAWLKKSGLKDVAAILKGLKNSGRACDCSIVDKRD